MAITIRLIGSEGKKFVWQSLPETTAVLLRRFFGLTRMTSAVTSIARVYPDINVHQPRDYWDYEALTVTWGYVRFVAYVRNNISQRTR